MATTNDSLNKPSEAAASEAVTAAAKPVVAPAPADAAAPVAKAAKPARKIAAKAAALKKLPAKPAKPVAAKRVAKVTSAQPVAKPVSRKPLLARPEFNVPDTARFVETAKQGFETMNDAFRKTTEDAKVRTEALMGDVTERARTAAAKAQALTGDMVEFQKGNLEAVVESGKIAAKHMEVIGREAVAFGKQSIEDTTAAVKSYAGVKSPTEFFQLYTENSKKAFDAMVAQGSKTSELMVKMANDSFQPISSRMAVAMSKIKSAA